MMNFSLFLILVGQCLKEIGEVTNLGGGRDDMFLFFGIDDCPPIGIYVLEVGARLSGYL